MHHVSKGCRRLWPSPRFLSYLSLDSGDTVAVWAATELAEKELGWKAKYDIADMCRDQWRWAQKYPQVSGASATPFGGGV